MQKQQNQPMTIDLREVYAILRKNIKPIAKITGLCVLLAGAYLLVASPVYEATSTVRVKQPKGIGSSLLDAMPGSNSMATKQLMSTYAEILKSRNVVIPVMDKTEKKADKKFFGLVSIPEEEQKLPSYDAYVKNRIKTLPLKDTEIMTVAVTAKTAEGAKKANDLLLDSFLDRLTSLSRNEQKQIKGFLETRVKESKKELNVAEGKVNAFQKENKVIAPDEEIRMAAEKMSMTDKMKAENMVAAATGNAKAAASAGQLASQGQRMADNSVIKAYNAKLAALEAQRIEYASKYTEKHPAMVKINQDIADMEKQLNAAIHEVANGQVASDNPVYNGVLASQLQGQSEAAIAQSNLAALAQVEQQYQEDIEELSDTQREYLSLLRDKKVAEEIYVMLSKRLEEAKVAEVSVATEVQIVDRAALPEQPVRPRKALTLLIAALLGMFASGGYVVVMELTNRTVKTAEDVENYLGLPVLGQIPDYNSLKKSMEDAKKPQGHFWDKLRGGIGL